MLTDEVIIKVKAGNGGNGSVSFLREKYRPNGGPDGGDGGDGGSIIFKVEPNLNTLTYFDSRKVFNAPHGENGTGRNKHGLNAENLLLLVPPGTQVYEDDKLLVDMKDLGQEFLVVKGGSGGWGNQHFATSIKQAPKWAKEGLPGEEKELKLELKMIADVGIIGFPNAGKSTFLSTISNARPKIADYPFTTLEPNLGVATIHDKEVVFADNPGLIEGASTGRGLGDKFLKHIERTKVLLILIPADSENPVRDYKILINELNDYSENLAKKKMVLAISKSELLDEKGLKKIAKDFKKIKLSPIFFSSATHKNIDELKEEIFQLLK